MYVGNTLLIPKISSCVRVFEVYKANKPSVHFYTEGVGGRGGGYLHTRRSPPVSTCRRNSVAPCQEFVVQNHPIPLPDRKVASNNGVRSWPSTFSCFVLPIECMSCRAHHKLQISSSMLHRSDSYRLQVPPDEMSATNEARLFGSVPAEADAGDYNCHEYLLSVSL